MFNWADIVIVGILVLSVLISIMRGFIREVFSLITWVAAFYVALMYSKPLAAMLAQKIHSPTAQIVIAFVILFLVTLIIGGLLSFLFGQLVDKTGLSGTDRLFGILFGLARGGLLISVVLLVASFSYLPREAWWKESKLIPKFEPIGAWLKDFLPTNNDKNSSETSFSPEVALKNSEKPNT